MQHQQLMSSMGLPQVAAGADSAQKAYRGTPHDVALARIQKANLEQPTQQVTTSASSGFFFGNYLVQVLMGTSIRSTASEVDTQLL